MPINNPATLRAFDQAIAFGQDYSHGCNSSTVTAVGLVNSDSLATLGGSLTSTYHPGDPVGTYSIVPAINDADCNPSYLDGVLTVSPAPATLTYTGDGTMVQGWNGAASATLTDSATGNPVAGQTLTFAWPRAQPTKTAPGPPIAPGPPRARSWASARRRAPEPCG